MKNLKIKHRALSWFLVFVLLFSLVPVGIAQGENDGEDSPISVTYNITGGWGDNHTVQVVISNESESPIENWAVGFEFPDNADITSAYSAAVVSHEDGYVILKNSGWNGTLAPNATANIGFEYIGDYTEVPEEFELCELSQVELNNVDVSFALVPTWDGNWQGSVSLTNNGETAIDGWELRFNSSDILTGVYSAVLKGQDNGGWIVRDAGWNGTINSGATVSFDVQGNGTAMTLEDVVVYTRQFVRPVRYNGVVDDNIDYADIENLVQSGIINVSQDEYGRFRAIFGRFSNRNVQNAEDAALVLNALTPLLGSGFNAHAEDFRHQNIFTGTTEEENFWRYSPTSRSLPVYGSQIILSTDKNGHVTGIVSVYDSDINAISITPTFTQANAEIKAVSEFTSDTELAEQIDVSSEKIIYNGDSDKVPVLAWKVTLSIERTAEQEDEDSSETEDMGEDNTEDGDTADATSEGESGEEEDGETADATSEGEDTEEQDDETDDTSEGEDTEEQDGETADDTSEDEDTELPSDDEDTSEDVPATLAPYTKVYYIGANGADAGEVLASSADSLNANVQTHAITAQDLNNQDQSVTVKNSTLEIFDKERDIAYERYKSGPENYMETEPIKFDNANSYDKEAVSAYKSVSTAYDFYNNVLKHRSFRNIYTDTTPIKVVLGHYDVDDNGVHQYKGNSAYIAESDIILLDQYRQNAETEPYAYNAKAIDVAAHEYTHGVMHYVVGKEFDQGDTKNFTYVEEKLAIGEAYGDIMGNLIEASAKGYTVHSNVSGMWLFGEDAVAGRNMKEPDVSKNAIHYNDIKNDNLISIMNSGDQGGGHTFSTILSHAAYLMMTDSRTNSFSTVKWAKLYYKSMCMLPTTAKFSDAKNAILAAGYSYVNSNNDYQNIIIPMEDAFAMVGIMDSLNLRIVVEWSKGSRDLDSHTRGPNGTGGQFHVWYGQLNYKKATSGISKTVPIAQLNYDFTNYGKEITTIRNMEKNQPYYFYLHDFSGAGWGNSDCVIKVFKGFASTPMQTFTVNKTASGRYWSVCSITLSNSGQYTISNRNTYGSSYNFN